MSDKIIEGIYDRYKPGGIYDQTKTELQSRSNRIHISGYSLKYLNWKKEKLTWIKGQNKIIFTGAAWFFNGKKIEYVDELQ